MSVSDNGERSGPPEDGERTGFGTTGTVRDEHLAENSKENLDDKLDNAVDETFPGSDPVSVKITK